MNLEEKVAELEERVAWLENELGISQSATMLTALQHAFPLRKQCLRVLLSLYQAKGRVLSRAFLSELHCPAAEGTKIVDVYVCYLRNALGADSIRTAWGIGFQLTAAGAARVEDALKTHSVDLAA